MYKTLVIEASNAGEESVGIQPLHCKIMIEADTEMQEVLDNINYLDNLKLFKKDIQNLLLWIDSMPSTIDNIYLMKVSDEK